MEIKTIKDYYDQMYELYPNVKKSDIKKILNFGWKSLFQHNNYGGDVLIRDNDSFIYFGRLMKDSGHWFNYYKKKLSIKIKILFKRRTRGIPWDGYYYFALDKQREKEFWAQKNTKGRPRTTFTFGPIILFKIKEECIAREAEKCIILRVPMNMDLGWHVFKRQSTLKNVEVVLQRNNKLADILVTNNNFRYV